ncbi:hypothetical protein HAP47_0023180 [Bradyrhizobium sp. 41S5]|uniref:hypothetical protein n=1 Tax=Bradyrhizobium sp. 41S5 TaxID=1404443 RepID=UPI00156A98FD|nr:hypothetical protein [Bradyrhizobium sp. 41S5]UFX42166.1 hypothetical protein HAP47_0023180 [Bradyrhizobium sp. 41S5]
MGHQRGFDVLVERIFAQLNLGHFIEGGAQHIKPPLDRRGRMTELRVQPFREVELARRSPERNGRHGRLGLVVQILLGKFAGPDRIRL